MKKKQVDTQHSWNSSYNKFVLKWLHMGPIDRLAALYDVYGIYLLATLTEYGK